jgi:hypothetical protein
MLKLFFNILQIVGVYTHTVTLNFSKNRISCSLASQSLT